MQSGLDDPSFSTFLEANQEAQVNMGVRDAISPWAGSPFEWLMSLPSRSRGRAGEVLAAAWLTKLGHQVQLPRSSEHDRLVNGRAVEIKFSTLWANGDYVFQQLRRQAYDFVLMLGVSPNAASVWFPPKEIALEMAIPQHGGSTGVDTRWLRFPAESPPEALRPHGGSPAQAAELLRRVLG